MVTNSIPKVWRKVIAVDKPGKDLNLAASYRPISLLSVCYKLLEHLALQRISLTVEGILKPGFSLVLTKARFPLPELTARVDG